MSLGNADGRLITLGYLNFFDMPPRDLVSLAGEAGYASAGIRITGRRPEDAYHEVVGNDAAIHDIMTRAANAGVSISNVSSYHLHPDVGLDVMEPVLEATRLVGARTLITARYDPVAERFYDFMARLAEVAARYEVRLAFEFVPFSEAKSIADARALLESVPAENLGLMIDPLHLARSGGTPADLAGLDPERLFLLQLCDASSRKPDGVDLRREARTSRLFPGEGELPLAEFLAATPADVEIEIEAPHAGYASLPPLEQARLMRVATLSYLAGLRAGTDARR